MAAVPFKVKAVYDYASQEPDDLSFPLGQIITVTEEIDADWYEGEYTDVTGIKKSGIFPNNFVEKYEPEVPKTRPSRPAKEAAPAISSAPIPVASSPALSAEQKEVAREETPVALPPSASTQQAPEPAQSAPETTAEARKPPPVAPKSNAFKDRIAAFNAPAAAPILPFTPGRAAPSTFIKKPFVAPPPSKDAYVPQPKAEVVQRPYVREEDPEIKQRQEDDLAAAQAVGLATDEQDEAEDTPKPQSLKDRIALLQKQQMEQAQRRVAPPPPRKSTEQDPLPEHIQPEDEQEKPVRASTENRERPRVPTLPREAPTSPGIPQHEILSGGEEADQSAAETTEDDAHTIEPEEDHEGPLPHVPTSTQPEIEHDEIEEAEDETEVPDEDDVDEETRRRLELRERMAKMSGGMGMAGMFGPPGGMPMPGMSVPKKAAPREKRSTEDSAASTSLPTSGTRMVPVPSIQRVLSPELEDSSHEAEPPRQASIEGRRSLTETRAPPPVPDDRPVPQPPPRTSVPPTIPIPAALLDSDDDNAQIPQASSLETPRGETPITTRGGRPQDARNSYFADNMGERRASKTPQIPSSHPLAASRPAPPLPPTTGPETEDDDDDDRGESEYEGDYDTDIASSAKHKDALKAHNREPSYDDSTTADETPLNSPGAHAKAPPVPIASRAAPPPPPAMQAPIVPPRQPTELPRAPPPMPPPRAATGDDEEYDPYRYAQQRSAPPSIPQGAIPPVPPRPVEDDEESSDDLYTAPPPRKSMDRPPPPPPTQTAPQDNVPPAPSSATQAIQSPPRAPPRQSLELQGRRSMDQNRSLAENGQIAGNVDLDESTAWWTAPQPLPPSLQGRDGVDLIYECEETSTSKRGGRTTISKDIYILFIDYSQTIITARYDSREPADVSIEQRHEPAPAKLRQDQLENFWQRFGKQIAETANNLGNSKKDTTIGDGSATSLVHELIKAQPEALLPVGIRAYGALVYANLANASVMQFDEIRPGDIVTLRNAKFEGKHSGPIHQKYKQELGASHVAIVNEWDGTKKKIKTWEQGREKKAGLKSESYRLGDLKSGEVRVWRVVGRQWVGWESNA